MEKPSKILKTRQKKTDKNIEKPSKMSKNLVKTVKNIVKKTKMLRNLEKNHQKCRKTGEVPSK